MNDLSLGYNVKLNNATLKYVKRLYLYVTGQNLFCITKYKGLDPELTNGDIMNQGDDPRDKYPSIRSFTFGLNVTF